MKVHIQSRVFDITLKYNANAVTIAAFALLAIVILLACASTPSMIILGLAFLLAYFVIVGFLLFSQFKFDAEKGEVQKNAPEQHKAPAKKEPAVSKSKRQPPPVPKLDIPVPDMEKPVAPPVSPTSQPASDVTPQDVAVVPDWRKLLSGKE